MGLRNILTSVFFVATAADGTDGVSVIERGWWNIVVSLAISCPAERLGRLKFCEKLGVPFDLM